jgi:enoyl-CoA hydratase
MTNHALSQPAVDLREAEGVWWITFDRPEASNAFTLADLDRLAEIFQEAGARPPRAAVLTGAGPRAFSAGMHLQAFSDLTPERAREFIVKNRRLLAAVRTAPFPTIAAINGHCLGTGLGLALVSDLRIAVPHATFGLPEIKVGVPSVCDIALLQQHIGLSKAKEVILTGDSYSVSELAPCGFLNAVVSADELVADRAHARESGPAYPDGHGGTEAIVRDLANDEFDCGHRHECRCLRRRIRLAGNV